MLCIRATVVAGANHDEYPLGTRVAAVLFAAEDEIEAAESLIAPVLREQGWSKLETERYKEVASVDAVSDPLLQDAFNEAARSGVGYVLYPGQ